MPKSYLASNTSSPEKKVRSHVFKLRDDYIPDVGCMYVCVRMYMCARTHRYTHTHVPSEYRDQKTLSGLILQAPSTLFFIVLALTHYTKLSGPKAPEVCLPLPPQY